MQAERQGTPSTSDRRQHSDEDEDGADYELSRRELEAEIGSRSVRNNMHTNRDELGFQQDVWGRQQVQTAL